jgi:hypothetical protein
MQRKSFKVFADYNQFYLWDKKVGPDAPEDYSDADVENRIKVAPNVFVVQPERSDEVPVTVEVHSQEPSYDPEIWDHIAEASLDLPSGQLQVHECTGGPVALFKVEPGWYRVRSFHGGLATIDQQTCEGNDHYLVALWPAPSSDLKVLKQYRASSDI